MENNNKSAHNKSNTYPLERIHMNPSERQPEIETY